jgi:hypothetical protein
MLDDTECTVLEATERELAADDPRFARGMRRVWGRGRFWL